MPAPRLAQLEWLVETAQALFWGSLAMLNLYAFYRMIRGERWARENLWPYIKEAMTVPLDEWRRIIRKIRALASDEDDLADGPFGTQKAKPPP